MMRLKWILFAFTVLGFSRGYAQTDLVGSDPMDTYYSIAEGSSVLGFEGPENVASRWVKAARMGVMNLLNWDLHSQPFPAPVEKYVRAKHFGTWVDDPRDNSCLDTRAKVLVRDSSRPVIFSPTNRCRVEAGEWHEPYAGKVLTRAGDIQIDHVVALKNAYDTGASRWNFLARCLYANYLGNGFHLLAVDGPENMRKSDKSPADWLPTNPNIRCEFVRAWLAIKGIWGLVMSAREIVGIRQAILKSNCDVNQFALDSAYVSQQRAIINQNMNLCVRLASGM